MIHSEIVNYLSIDVVQSNTYYKSRAIGVTSEVGLTTDRDLSVLIFDERLTRRTSVAQDTPGGFKNATGPVNIPLKRSTSGTRL